MSVAASCSGHSQSVPFTWTPTLHLYFAQYTTLLSGEWLHIHLMFIYLQAFLNLFFISFHWKNIKWISKKNAAFLSRFSNSLLWQTNFLIFKLVLDDNQFNVHFHFFCIILISLSFLMIFLIFYYPLYNINTN